MAATWAEISGLRLKVCDPVGIIALETVANYAALPASPVSQTAYQTADTAEYYAYDADLAAWERLDLEISDARIDGFVTLYGADRAVAPAIRAILAMVGRRLGIARASGGAESVDFQTLSDTYRFYKDLAASYDDEAAAAEGVSSGLYLRMRRPRIGGGM